MSSLVWDVLYPSSKIRAVMAVSLVWIIITSIFYKRNAYQSVLINSWGGPSSASNIKVQNPGRSEDNSLNWVDFTAPIGNNRTPSKDDQVKNCVIPQLLENDPVMMKFYKKLAPPKCTDEEWLYVENGTVRFSKSAILKHKRLTCDYYPLIRDGDFAIKYGAPVKNIADGHKMTSDFFKGVCRSLATNETNLSIYSGIHYSEDRAKRKKYEGATTLDKFPFFWHDARKRGYLTSWCNAVSGPFNWRMLGFNEAPTDFYTRPYYMAVKKDLKSKVAHCIRARTESRVWLDYFKDIFLMYPKQRKFLFHFSADFSHDDNNPMTIVRFRFCNCCSCCFVF
ncbi:DUF229 domain containing protein [Elysia marginata]|uniref:DUF229 domain containing protein n=1 Tax=Elysia marginata TaxID=1093978 RepID=A0AAV4JJ67_9GAST|nr:DUF229 domain containing protein [Elysia marginata]